MTIADEAAVEDLELGINARRLARLEDIPARSEAWLETRKLGLGGSDAAAVCGLGEFKSAYETYLDKTMQHPDGLTIPENRAMKWGRLLEDAVAAENARKRGTIHIKPTWLYQHRELDWMLANPDCIVLDPEREGLGIYEGKTCSSWMADRWGEDGSDSPATYALFQAVHYLAVLDLQWADISVLIGGQDDRHYRIERDEELVSMLIEYEADFWDRVLRRDEPPVTGSAGDTALLMRMYEAVEGKTVLLGEEAEELVRSYNENHDAMKKAEWHKNVAANQLRQLMGDAEVGMAVDGRQLVTWRQHETTKFDEARFKEEMPRFYATYTSKEPQRTLRPSKKV